MFENTFNYRGYLLPVSVYFSVDIFFNDYSRVGAMEQGGVEVVTWTQAGDVRIGCSDNVNARKHYAYFNTKIK